MILRELLIKLGLDIDEAKFAKGQLAAEVLVKGFEKLVDIGKEAIESFVQNIEKSVEYGDQIQKTSQKIGIATDALQELQYAGHIADLSAQDMSRSIGLLSKNMEKAKTGSAEASKIFKGISFLDHGKLKPTEEVLGNIADKFAAMPDGAEKTALAMELFGRSGKELIPLLNKGSGELEDMRKEARELGLVMDKDAVEASEKLADNFKRLKQITEGLWRGAIAPLLPAINRLVERFLAWKKANAEIIRQRLQHVIGLVVKGVELLADGFDFLVKNMETVKTIAIALVIAFVAVNAAAVGAAIAAAAAWALAALPFVAIAAAIAAIMLLYDDLRVYHEGKGKSVFGLINNTLDDWLKPNQKDPWFVRAIKSFVSFIREALSVLDDLDKQLQESWYVKLLKYTPGGLAGQVIGHQFTNRYKTTEETGLIGPRAMAQQAATNAEGRTTPTATPEFRGSSTSSSSTKTIAPVFHIGPITQQPGEKGFAERVTQLALDAFRGHVLEPAGG